MNNSLLTVKEVADLVKISTSTVYCLCKKGIPHTQKTCGIRIHQEALDKWIGQDERIYILTRNILRKTLTNLPLIDIDKAK